MTKRKIEYRAILADGDGEFVAHREAASETPAKKLTIRTSWPRQGFSGKAGRELSVTDR
jgi:hypothetical protein